MRVVIAMPRMSTDPEPTVAQSKYMESLARAGAGMRWVELNDPEQAVQDALTCDGLLLPGGGDMDPKFYGQERIPPAASRIFSAMQPSRCCCAPFWPQTNRCWASAGASRS